MRSGRGVLRRRDGSVYDGEWRLSQRHGQGQESWPNGDTYYGAWKNDSFDGQGTLARCSGRYVGEVSAGAAPRHSKHATAPQSILQIRHVHSRHDDENAA
jgi:hypothetical protein